MTYIGKHIESVPLNMALVNDENDSTHVFEQGPALIKIAKQNDFKELHFIDPDTGKVKARFKDIQNADPDVATVAWTLNVIDGGLEWDFI